MVGTGTCDRSLRWSRWQKQSLIHEPSLKSLFRFTQPYISLLLENSFVFDPFNTGHFDLKTVQLGTNLYCTGQLEPVI